MSSTPSATPLSTLSPARKRLLALRRAAKKKKPNFVVKSSHYSARVTSRWRYPRGRHSPIRQMHRGKPALVRIGYGAPQEVRGLHPSGLEPIVVASPQELLSVQKGKQGAILSRTLGARKRAVLLQLAQKEGIPLLNVKDITKALQGIMEKIASRKKARQEKNLQKSKKQDEQQKKVEKKKEERKKEGKEKAEEKKEEEKELLEKTLTKKQ